ncbi:complex I NDUFA9 subunit family protein [Xanthobacter oligotrophicus]|uniref:complex I NDUFA9 subunit family protein n=1 Tax=Xanthobacter oligotrophicus TaxID=2607286 RepID=UPI0011F2B4E4|nr:complex I NDUFA9 subunit family protein [Xanthobacter oligotrophicus]MCG5235083.1 complex I NDUFA9 subunit family protein [Xanthobacter oligotrophicus]
MSDVTVTDRPVSDSLVTVFGGSGFLGRHVVRALAMRGYRVRVAVRRPELAGFLQPLGFVGQIQVSQANVRYPESVARAVDGAEAVVNLVGVLAQGGRQSFDAIHVFGARAIAQAAAREGSPLVHISAIGADAASASGYGRTKAEGEAAVRAAAADAIIFRPSVMFGPEDEFFNRFAAMARLSPVLPLIGGGVTRFQPVFVGDVAAAILKAVDGKAKAGATYELGGPEVRTFRELMELVLHEICHKRLLVDLPFGLANLMARLTQWAPGAPLTTDQVAMLRTDNVVSDAAKTEGRSFAGLDITPTALATVLPTYLWRFRKAGQFTHVET